MPEPTPVTTWALAVCAFRSDPKCSAAEFVSALESFEAAVRAEERALPPLALKGVKFIIATIGWQLANDPEWNDNTQIEVRCALQALVDAFVSS